MGAHSLLGVEGGDTWKDLAFQKLQRRAAAGRNVGHLVCKSSLAVR